MFSQINFKVLGALVVAIALCAPADGFAKKLTIGGTGGDLGTMRQLGEAFTAKNPGVTVEVLPSLGSGGGIKAVLAGAIDVSVSSRALKDKEKSAGARARPYAKTALVFATAPSTPHDGVTSEQVIGIYAGDIMTWPDGTAVRIVLRPKGDGDAKLISAQMAGMGEAMSKAARRPGVPVGVTDQDAVDEIEKLPGGLGFTSLSVILGERRRLKVLTLDGAAATPEAIADGSYPVGKTFYLVNRLEPGELARAFIAFIESAEGIAVLRRTGHVELE